MNKLFSWMAKPFRKQMQKRIVCISPTLGNNAKMNELISKRIEKLSTDLKKPNLKKLVEQRFTDVLSDLTEQVVNEQGIRKYLK